MGLARSRAVGARALPARELGRDPDAERLRARADEGPGPAMGGSKSPCASTDAAAFGGRPRRAGGAAAGAPVSTSSTSMMVSPGTMIGGTGEVLDRERDPLPLVAAALPRALAFGAGAVLALPRFLGGCRGSWSAGSEVRGEPVSKTPSMGEAGALLCTIPVSASSLSVASSMGSASTALPEAGRTGANTGSRSLAARSAARRACW